MQTEDYAASGAAARTATTAVLYAAKSTEDTNSSIQTQFDACEAYGQRQGWTVHEERFSDEAASAFKASRGHGLVAAKQFAATLAAAGGEIVLLVFDPDRLARG